MTGAQTESDGLFPIDAITAWLDENAIAVGAPLHHERLAGGRSNVMFRITRGGNHLVLRRPARVAVAKADDGMRREFRILRALEGTPVPHPRPVALCDDPDRIGCVFYVMEDVPGVNPTALPDALGPAATARGAVTMAVTDALASLHDVDWEAAGLHDFGRPDRFHERQVGRWTTQLESYQGEPIPDIERIGPWLEANRPTTWTPTIMHADYHMLNVLIAEDAPARVTAIVDWETATIGDPLLDLAGFVEVWCSAYHDDGWPDRAAIIDHYATVRGLGTIPDLRYYEVLYNFRLGVLLEGVHQRSRLDESRDDDALARERSSQNFRRAVALVDGA